MCMTYGESFGNEMVGLNHYASMALFFPLLAIFFGGVVLAFLWRHRAISTYRDWGDAQGAVKAILMYDPVYPDASAILRFPAIYGMLGSNELHWVYRLIACSFVASYRSATSRREAESSEEARVTDRAIRASLHHIIRGTASRNIRECCLAASSLMFAASERMNPRAEPEANQGDRGEFCEEIRHRLVSRLDLPSLTGAQGADSFHLEVLSFLADWHQRIRGSGDHLANVFLLYLQSYTVPLLRFGRLAPHRRRGKGSQLRAYFVEQRRLVILAGIRKRMIRYTKRLVANDDVKTMKELVFLVDESEQANRLARDALRDVTWKKELPIAG